MNYKIDPKYNALDRLGKWDEVTQGAIKKRLDQEIGTDLNFTFLSQNEGQALKIITDVLIPQGKNKDYIKIAQVIDNGLSDKKEGVRYGDNPWSGEFYKQGLAEVKKHIQQAYAKQIENLDAQELNHFVSRIMGKDPDVFLRRFIKRVLSDSINIYFSHPGSWNAIGFPGPAFPEGYAYLGCGEKDEWEPKYNKNNEQ